MWTTTTIEFQHLYRASLRTLDNKMTHERFCDIIGFIRFDVKSMHSQRLLSDKFTHISEIWNKFIENCIACYRPGDNIIIDEQLFPTKARSPFT